VSILNVSLSIYSAYLIYILKAIG